LSKFSAVNALDKSIEHALEEQCKVANINISNSAEVELRMSETTFPSGEKLWKIDNRPILKLQIQNLTEDVIVFTLEKVKWKRDIIVNNKIIMAN
jgi:post-segregation antitoxin (ccd killing protein)